MAIVIRIPTHPTSSMGRDGLLVVFLLALAHGTDAATITVDPDTITADQATTTAALTTTAAEVTVVGIRQAPFVVEVGSGSTVSAAGNFIHRVQRSF